MGQNLLQSDTILIGEVVISRQKNESGVPGYRNIVIDSSLLARNTSMSLADLISESTALSLKSYGSGGIASPAFRGTAAKHTMVLWNGIIVDNPMLGQSDFSIVPAGFADNIRISLGGGSMESGSGGFGGAINYDTAPLWDSKTKISASAGAGSFGQISALASVVLKNDNLQSVSKFFLNSSENNFKYLDNVNGSEPVWGRRQNGQLFQKGVLQEFYLRNKQSLLSARIWYQSASRNLASPIIAAQIVSNEHQDDVSLRSMIDYKYSSGRTEYAATAAWLSSKLFYSNRTASVESENIANTLVLKGGITGRIKNSTKFRVLIDNELIYVNSNNYTGNTYRNRSSFTLVADLIPGGRLNSYFLLREIIDNKQFMIPDFSAGFELRVMEEKDYFLKWNVSKNSRIPTMNELYWNPGGNPDLVNENAFMYEVGYRAAQKIGESFFMISEFNVFNNQMKNMIHWRPGQFSYWMAENIRNAVSAGFESDFSLKYSLNKSSFLLNTGYTYTKSIIKDPDSKELKNKQIMYIPVNQSIYSFRYNYGNFYTSIRANITGRRYISADNLSSLPSYILTGLSTGFRMNSENYSLNLIVRAENLFNVKYESIAFYPQPGRSYQITIIVDIIK
jgi:iron complex outermembrane receptor protein